LQACALQDGLIRTLIADDRLRKVGFPFMGGVFVFDPPMYTHSIVLEGFFGAFVFLTEKHVTESQTHGQSGRAWRNGRGF